MINNFYKDEGNKVILMPRQQLISYIQQQLNQGYDLNSIKTYLINYGYDKDEVEQAISSVYAPKKPKPRKIILIAGIIIIAVLAISIILILSKPGKEEISLSIDTELGSKNIIPGGYIMFNTEIEKSGAGMVLLNHIMTGPDGKEISSIEETTFKSKSAQFKIPSDAKPGRYAITTSAELGGIKKTSKITFSIAQIGEDIIPEEEPQEEEEEPEEEEEEEIPVPVVDEDEFASLTIWERVEAIKIIAQTSAIEAKSHCDKIGVAGHQNQCYYNVAEESGDIAYCQLITEEKISDRCQKMIAEITNNSNICTSISHESRRDNCYMSFVKMGDYSLCDKFVNKYYKESCEALKIMASIPDYSQYQIPEPE